MTGSVTFSTSVGGDGSTVTDDDNATTGLRNGGWRTRFVPCFTNQVAVASFVVTQATNAASSASSASTSATNAATSASSASTYASNASSSASSASTSATNAATSASAAASSAATVAASFSSPPAFGNTTPNTGAFTTLSASSTVSGTGFSNYLASPPAIGGTAAAAGSFTTLSASSTVTFSGGTANGVVYLNGSKVATSGSALTFDGANLGVSGNINVGGNVSIAKGNTGDAKFSFDITTVAGGAIGFNNSGSSNVYGAPSGALYIGLAQNYPIVFTQSAIEQMRLTSTGLGIGTSSPATKLDITSGLDATYNTNVIINSTANSAKIAFNPTGVTSSGIGADATGLRFYASGANTVRATIDYSGNLGLGVTPSAWGNSGYGMLQVKGNAAFGGLNYGAGYTIVSNNAYDSALGANKYLSSGYATQYFQTAGQHLWYTAPSGTAGNAITFTQAMTLDASGNLGLGTTSPRVVSGYTNLSINGSASGLLEISTNNTRVLSVYGASNDIYLVNPTATGTMQFYTNNTTRMIIDASGNLGLGVTPSGWNTITPLQIKNASFSGTASQAFVGNNWYYASADKYISSAAAGLFQINGSSFTWLQAPSGTAGAAITFTQAMALDASGNLLVGMTSVAANANGIVFETQYGLGRYSHASGTASGQYYSLFLYNNTAIGSITQNSTTGVLYNITSDQRLKTNIVNAPDASQIIDSIQVRSFDWLADGSHQRYGMIAQELLEVVPEAVSVPADEEEMMGVDYSKLVPMLIKEMQSLRTRVANLEK